MKTATTLWLMLAVLLGGVSLGRASDRASDKHEITPKDETILTVQVSSADHELAEGYFALGEQATVLAKPGSDLFRFLSRQRGQKVRIVLTKSDTRELSRLQR